MLTVIIFLLNILFIVVIASLTYFHLTTPMYDAWGNRFSKNVETFLRIYFSLFWLGIGIVGFLFVYG